MQRKISVSQVKKKKWGKGQNTNFECLRTARLNITVVAGVPMWTDTGDLALGIRLLHLYLETRATLSYSFPLLS